MANRYWVGGTGNWSDDTNHWATSSNGSPGAGNLPTSADDVFIDSSSGFGAGGTITLDSGAGYPKCHNFLSNSGHNYTLGNSYLLIYGSLTLESGITGSDLNVFTKAETGDYTITTAGVVFNQFSIDADTNVGDVYTATWTLQDNLVATGTFYQQRVTFDANDHSVTANDFYFYADTGYTPTVIMGSGTWEATGGSWFIDENSGEVVTITSETSTIKFTDATASTKQFFSKNHTYYNLWLSGTGTGNFSICPFGSNTFNDIKCDNPPHTIIFGSPYTQTVSTFTVSGTAGNLITLTNSGLGSILTSHISTAGTGYSVNEVCSLSGGTGLGSIRVDTIDGGGGITGYTILDAGGNFTTSEVSNISGGNFDAQLTIDTITVHISTLSKSSGTVICDYLDISNSNATGGATWYAGSHSNNTTNNSGWIFTDPPSSFIKDMIGGFIPAPR